MRREMRWLFSVFLRSSARGRAGGDRAGLRAGSREEASRAASTEVRSSSPSARWAAPSASGTHQRSGVRWAGCPRLLATGSVHATLWRGTTPVDLGPLGGPNSAVLWPSKNDDRSHRRGRRDRGGPAARGDLELPLLLPLPHGEDLPRRGLGQREHPRAAHPRAGRTASPPRPTTAVRSSAGRRTQVLDPTCTGRQKRQFLAALWGPGQDEMRELPPLPGDSTSAATGINDRGQAMGISGACGIAVGGVSARRAVMWERTARITDLGTLGGEGWNTPMALNAWGDVVGLRQRAGDAGGPTSCPSPSSGPAPRRDRGAAAAAGRRQRTGAGHQRLETGGRCLLQPAAAGACSGRTARSSTCSATSSPGWSAPSSTPGTSTTWGASAASPSTRLTSVTTAFRPSLPAGIRPDGARARCR